MKTFTLESFTPSETQFLKTYFRNWEFSTRWWADWVLGMGAVSAVAGGVYLLGTNGWQLWPVRTSNFSLESMIWLVVGIVMLYSYLSWRLYFKKALEDSRQTMHDLNQRPEAANIWVKLDMAIEVISMLRSVPGTDVFFGSRDQRFQNDMSRHIHRQLAS